MGGLLMKALAITALIVVLGTRAAEATTYNVCSGDPPCYPDLQSAVTEALKSNTGGNAVINVDTGIWLGASISGPTPGASGPLGKGYLVIQGQGGVGPAKTTIKDSNPPGQCGTIIVTNNASVMVQDLNLETSLTPICQSSLFVQNNAVLQIGSGVNFGLAINQHMHAEAQGMIESGVGYTVSGGAYSHWAVATNGYIEIDPVLASVITFSNTVIFAYGGPGPQGGPGYFAWAQSGGVIFFGGGPDGATFVGLENVTAAYKYVIKSNGVIDMNESTQVLPGRSIDIESGGQYVVEPVGRGSGRRGRPR
jgi:hypothetical protein